MKLAKIKALCLEKERFEIVNGPGCQWIGNGCHFYRVYGARLEIDALDRLLGVKETKAAECAWDEYDFEEAVKWRDAMVPGLPEALPIADVYGYGEQLMALDAGGRVLYLRQAALDALEEDRRRTFQLKYVGGLKVACCHGVQVDALLQPLGEDEAREVTAALSRVGSLPVLEMRSAVLAAAEG